MALSEIARPISRSILVKPGTAYRTIGVKWWGEGAYERQTIDGSETAAKTLSLVREGDLIINKIWVRHGSTAIVTKAVDGCAASGEFPTFELDATRVIPRWLHWQTKTRMFWAKCDALSRGTSGKNRIKPELFLTITVPLPPLSEQRRIVARIEELAAKVGEARALRRQAAEEGEFFFASATKRVRLQSLTGSRAKRLGEIATVTSGGTPAREVATYWNGDVPWVKTGELKDADIRATEEYITNEGLQNSSAKVFPVDTVLVALYGQGQTRGRTGRLAIPASTNQACCAILPSPLLEPRFVQWWIRTLYYEMRENSHGGAQPNWNGQTIKNVVIAELPLKDQRRIVSYLDGLQAQVDALKKLQAATAAELDALLPSILDKAFKGEL
ncbi:MAG: restriction endonuclease subunit S [Planctomycetota bacterium]